MKISIRKIEKQGTDNETISAVSFAILIKSITESHNLVRDFNIKKVQKMTGMSFVSIKKYIKKLEQMQLVRNIGKQQNIMQFMSLAGKSNINIEINDFWQYDKTLKGSQNLTKLKYTLYSLLIVHKQSQKNYVQQYFKEKENPSSVKNLKKSLHKIRYLGYDIHAKFEDNGFSYNYWMKYLQVSRQKLSMILKFAEDNHIVYRDKRVEQFFFKGINKNIKVLDGLATFATKNNVYKVYANRYIVDERLRKKPVFSRRRRQQPQS